MDGLKVKQQKGKTIIIIIHKVAILAGNRSSGISIFVNECT